MVEMTNFNEDEQWLMNLPWMDLPWYAIDAGGRIGHFTTGGENLLPPSFVRNKEIWEKMHNYFSKLPIMEGGNFMICPKLQEQAEKYLITDIKGYIEPSAIMSARGLYAYDNPPIYDERPYIRVTIPIKELKLDALPENIRDLIKNMRIKEVNFNQDLLIIKEVTNKI